MIFTINGRDYSVILKDTEVTKQFLAMLPLTITMQELNGNEKYADLPKQITQNSYYPGKIHAGDIMLWGADTLVLFYKDFSTRYNYTAIGKLKNPKGIEETVGSQNISVKIKLDSLY